MALTTYSELKTAVARWTGQSDNATATNLGMGSSIDDLITVAETRIFREAKTKDNEASISTSLASGVLSVPSDYVAHKLLYINSNPVTFVEPRPIAWIYQNYPTRSSEGIPKYFAREATNFIFGPYPDSTYSVGGVYYKKLTALSTTVHNLFLNNPDLYLFCCLAESSILIGNDSRIPLWESKYQKILSDVNGTDKNSEYAGGSLQVRLA